MLQLVVIREERLRLNMVEFCLVLRPIRSPGQPAEGHVDPVQPEAALTTATQQSKALYRLQRTELKSIIGNVSDEKADELSGALQWQC